MTPTVYETEPKWLNWGILSCVYLTAGWYIIFIYHFNWILVIQHVTKQLNRLIPVVKVVDLNSLDHIERELILCKVTAKDEARSEILRIAEIFDAKIIDVTNKVYTIQAFGDSRQINSLIELLKPMGIKELVRSGKVAISRENQFVNLKNI